MKKKWIQIPRNHHLHLSGSYVSTDKNVNACSMEPLVEKHMLRDIKRELAKDQNNDLIEGYRTCGISNDALKELKSNGLRALSEEVPLLEFFRY
jgi:hypothetical protein